MKSNFKLLTFCLTALMAGTTVSARVYYDNDPYLSDLTIINCGDGDKRAKWTEEDFLPYLTHKYSDGHEEWFFDAFLFVDTQRGNKKFGNDIPGIPASQNDWKWMLDQFFDPELKLRALDNLIEKKKAELGEPALQHRVVLSLCLPCTDDGVWSRVTWGMIDGRNINFTTIENRYLAMQWYLDTMVERFNAGNYKNLTLSGVYWVEEGIFTNKDLSGMVADYVRSLGLRTYWIPFYKDNESSWSLAHTVHRFDLTYLQPNYAFVNGPDISVLEACCNAARLQRLGVELEFETISTSSALHSVNPALHQRIHDYLDAFESSGVAEKGAVSYYTGSQGLIDMDKSDDPVDHATMDRLAKFVAKRQAAKAAALSGIDDIEIEEAPIAYAGEGFINIYDEAGEASCYDIAGRLIHSGAGYFSCSPGIYIVRTADNRTVKLQVR